MTLSSISTKSGKQVILLFYKLYIPNKCSANSAAPYNCDFQWQWMIIMTIISASRWSVNCLQISAWCQALHWSPTTLWDRPLYGHRPHELTLTAGRWTRNPKCQACSRVNGCIHSQMLYLAGGETYLRLATVPQKAQVKIFAFYRPTDHCDLLTR